VIDKLNLRIGRRYRFVHHAPDGQQFAFRGAYLKIDCPHRLVRVVRVPGQARGRGHRHLHPSEPVDEATLVRLGKDPLEANQVLLWSVLENAGGAPVAVRGFEMLFDDRQPDWNKTEER